MILALFTASTVSAVNVPETAYGHIVRAESQMAVAREVAPTSDTEAAVRLYFQDIPVMIKVAKCESGYVHQLADGSILHGRVDSADTGVMQINLRYHGAAAAAMKLDLDNLHDNMAYARHLYETQGTRPWSASMSC
ncbi:MAG: hypothetical protein RLZZ230_810, partial [Candidatus Parcubacteria bacterium]